jgi:phosphatidylglycerol:prolipoprotein diacylglycerol transferase
VLAVVGMALGLASACRRAPAYGVARFDELALGLLGVAFGIVGAAVLDICLHLSTYVAEPARFLSPGLVFLGGLGGGVTAATAYARAYQVPLLPAADAASPGLALGHAVGRVGCLMGGCCYGRPAPAGWPAAVRIAGESLHPVQLYEAFGLVLLALLLASASRLVRPLSGALFALYLAGYGVLRWWTERYRGDDDDRVRLFGRLFTSQLLSLVLLGAALGLFVYSILSPKKGAY